MYQEIKTVEVKICCGTYCIWLTDKYGDRMKVAMFDMDDENKKQAKDFAKMLAQHLGAKIIISL